MPTASPLDRFHSRLTEAYTDLFNSFVDPREPYCDDGETWLPLSSGPNAGPLYSLGPANESQLADIRRQCRQLALENEFAINGHENRISYIIGPGHTYKAVPTKSMGATAGLPSSASPTPLVSAVQQTLDDFLTTNRWHSRQQEIVRRRDRDGEAFLRFFTAPDGTLRVRFVEPDQIYTPPEQAGNPAARLGILTDEGDVETIRGYFIDGRLVDASEIQHRKANADANCRRGIPLFYPVRKNLRRAEKLLRNMSIVAEIQSAIALIRKHRQATATGVQQFVANQSDAWVARPESAKGVVHRYPPGAILDTSANIDYDFPASGIDAANFVAVLQAELRAIASRLVMPEFMLTSDASNANYSSTMVAEGPALRMFARLQAEQVCDDLEVMWRVVDAAIAAGQLPPEARTQVEIQAVPPNLAVRDQLKDTQRYKIENAAGILSPQTWSQLAGLDYDQEQQNQASHKAPVTAPGAL
jgi:capsid protein